MNIHTALALSAAPAFICTVNAQELDHSLSAAEFVQAQIHLLQGVTQILNIKHIAEAPQEAAAGINQLSGCILQLAASKPTATPEEIATIHTDIGTDAKAITSSLQQALQKTIDNNFYNSQELLTAIQHFVSCMQQLQ